MSEIINTTFDIVSSVNMFKLYDVKHIYIVSYIDDVTSKVKHLSSEDDYLFPKDLYINGVEIQNAHQIEVLNTGTELLMYLTYFDSVLGKLITTVLTSTDAINWVTKNNLIIEAIDITDLSDIRVILENGRYVLFGSYQTYNGMKLITCVSNDGVTFSSPKQCATNHDEIDTYISGIVKKNDLYYIWYNSTEDGAFKYKLSISPDSHTLSDMSEIYHPNSNLLFINVIDNEMLITYSEILNNKLHFKILLEDITGKSMSTLFEIL
jgi:hypothetical protein